MTEVLFAINLKGELISARYYSITKETLEKKLLSDELLIEVLHRAKAPEGKDWNFRFEDIEVEILKRYEHKVEFFASRDVGIDIS
jgi:hypothetical protein